MDLKFGNGLFPPIREVRGRDNSAEGESCSSQHLYPDRTFPRGRDAGKQASLVRSFFSTGFVTAARGVLFVAGTIYNYIYVCVD